MKAHPQHKSAFLPLALVVLCTVTMLFVAKAQEHEKTTPGIGGISSNPTGARVFVDGVDMGSTPVKSLLLSRSVHIVIVKREQYVTMVDTVDLRVNNDIDLHYDLVPASTVSIAADPEGTSVYLSDRYYADRYYFRGRIVRIFGRQSR